MPQDTFNIAFTTYTGDGYEIHVNASFERTELALSASEAWYCPVYNCVVCKGWLGWTAYLGSWRRVRGRHREKELAALAGLLECVKIRETKIMSAQDL